jgi:hypothetical protein
MYISVEEKCCPSVPDRIPGVFNSQHIAKIKIPNFYFKTTPMAQKLYKIKYTTLDLKLWFEIFLSFKVWAHLTI